VPEKFDALRDLLSNREASNLSANFRWPSVGVGYREQFKRQPLKKLGADA
jgi:hypothetical protein